MILVSLILVANLKEAQKPKFTSIIWIEKENDVDYQDLLQLIAP